MIKRGIAIAHYNRLDKLGEIVEAVKRTAPGNTKIVICDDGSDTLDSGEHGFNDLSVSQIAKEHDVLLLQGPNKGVAANKNRGHNNHCIFV